MLVVVLVATASVPAASDYDSHYCCWLLSDTVLSIVKNVLTPNADEMSANATNNNTDVNATSTSQPETTKSESCEHNTR